MKANQYQYPVSVMSRVLKVSRSGYYAWLGNQTRKPGLQARQRQRCEVIVKAVNAQTRCTYGTKRLHDEIRSQGYAMSQWQVRQARQRLDLRCKQARKFKVTTNSQHTLPVAANLVMQCFKPTRPNQIWVADITYIHTAEGWLYLAGIKDVFSCELVGYAMAERMTQELCLTALQLAYVYKTPAAGLIHHSDRGSQYCSTAYQKEVNRMGMLASMSRKGNCYDNAPMESFWGTLKNELVHHQHYSTRQQAQEEITEYIEMFYNRQRRHSRLGNLSPAAFIQQFEQQQLLSP